MNTPQQNLLDIAADLRSRADQLDQKYGEVGVFAQQLRQQALNLERKASMPNLEDYPSNPVSFHAGTRG